MPVGTNNNLLNYYQLESSSTRRLKNYKYMQKLLLIFSLFVIVGCGSTRNKTSNKLQLKFLDEYILPENSIVDGTAVGGLSGIDYHDGTYYLVCDDAGNPRYYEAKIKINNVNISKVDIQKVIQLNDTIHFLDLEAIRYNAMYNQVFLTSEGHIKRQSDPLFFSVNTTGEIENIYEIPHAFKANSIQKPRHNGTLEGLSSSIDGKGYWIAMELPLEVDGPEPKLTRTKSPVRITFIDTKTEKPVKQFSYLLDAITKQPKGNFAVNGLTEILEYDSNKFFIIERSYSSGLGDQGNVIKIFNVDATEATNILKLNTLKDTNYVSAKKEIIFDFENVRHLLTDNSVDNIEGISFGPILTNGNKSLILISDNNFNKLGKQQNQFILLEIID